MKKIFPHAKLLPLFILLSCQSGPEQATISQSNQGNDGLKSTIELIGELPIHFDSTDYLLFPIGLINDSDRSKLYMSSGSSSDLSLNLGYFNQTGYNGSLDNIMIQHLDSTVFRPITDKPLKIRTLSFLAEIREALGHQMIVMTVIDSDTNQDGILADGDITSLYISDLTNSGIEKLSPENQKLIDWRLLKINNRLYFRTLEDSDKNDEFNIEDTVHYFFLELEQEGLKVVEYDPLI